MGNVPVSKGTGLVLSVFPSQYSEKYFKEPFVFRPERWEKECSQVPQVAVLGFSFGPRGCIGKQLAQLEIKIGLVKLLRRYTLIELPPGKRVMVRKLFYEPAPAKLTFTKAK